MDRGRTFCLAESNIKKGQEGEHSGPLCFFVNINPLFVVRGDFLSVPRFVLVGVCS